MSLSPPAILHESTVSLSSAELRRHQAAAGTPNNPSFNSQVTESLNRVASGGQILKEIHWQQEKSRPNVSSQNQHSHATGSDFHKIPDKEAKRMIRITSSKNVKDANGCLEEFKDDTNNFLSEFQEIQAAERYENSIQ